MRWRLHPAAALACVAIVALAIGAYRFHHDHADWTSDGAIYLRMTLQDRGESVEDARRHANAFMRTTAEARDPMSAGFYTDAPPAFYRTQYPLFRSRPLYPKVASYLYPRFGPDALKIVSAAAYVAAVVLMYLLLLMVASPLLAAAGALAFAMTPAVLNVAALPLTDELALAAWIAALAVLLRYLRCGSRGWFAALIAVSLLLTFVRPAIYLPFGAALGAFFGTPRGSPQRTAAGRAAIAIVAVGIVFFAYTLAVHGPGILDQLRWQYEWRVATHDSSAAHGFFAWWAITFASAFAEELVVEAYRHNALFAIVLAILGLFAARSTLVAAIALGSAAATVVALIVNPTELARTVTLPLAPIVIILATIALGRIASSLQPER